MRRGGFCDVCLQQQPAEHHADKQCDPGGEQDEQKLLIGPLARFDLLLDLIELSALAEGQDLPVGLDVVRLLMRSSRRAKYIAAPQIKSSGMRPYRPNHLSSGAGRMIVAASRTV